MDRIQKRVVVLLAHPNMKESQANKTFVDAIKEIDEVAVYDLYDMPTEDVFNVDEWSRIVSYANAIVFQFPFFWMAAPSLLKQWQDEVFTHLAKTPAVAGKPLMVVTTTGSSFDSYRSGGKNGFTVDELLRPYQAGITHGGMVWETPIVTYGMGTQNAERNIAKNVDIYRKRLEEFVGEDKAEDDWSSLL